MTMVLAIAMVACEGPAGVAGKDADPVKLPPLKVGTIPAMDLVVGGDAKTVVLSGYFSDPQGQTLTYAATSSMTAYATVSVTPTTATLTVTAVAAGKSTITVTATDTDKLMAKQTFAVTVAAAAPDPVPDPVPDPATVPGTIEYVKATYATLSLDPATAAGASQDIELSRWSQPEIERRDGCLRGSEGSGYHKCRACSGHGGYERVDGYCGIEG